MSASRMRTERLVNLVICLLSSRRFMSAEKIAATVPGYEHDLRDAKAHEAFQRKFERDKSELRRLGVPVETGTNSVFDAEPGYRIARRDYELPAIDLDPQEAAALGAAVRMWQHSKFAADADDGLWKLRAAGVDVRGDETPEIEPVLSVDESFAPVLSAVRQRREVRFDYVGRADDVPARRRLQPWGVVCHRGAWYAVGHDVDRGAERCFRLSRIAGSASAHGPENAFEPPADVNLLDRVARFHDDEPEQAPRLATLRVRLGRAAGLRRRAEQILARRPDGDRVVVAYTDPRRIAAQLAEYGADVTVLDPPEVRKEMAVLLADLAETHRPRENP